MSTEQINDIAAEPALRKHPSVVITRELSAALEGIPWPAAVETYRDIAMTRIFSTSEVADQHAFMARNDLLKLQKA